MAGLVIIRGGGDLASGTALRLHRSGARVIILELAQPLVVRRGVAFAQALFSGQTRVEEALAQRVENIGDALAVLDQNILPVMVDPLALSILELRPTVLIDGRMTKRSSEITTQNVLMTIGFGPGHEAGVDCDAVIETQRGHRLGQVIWHGAAMADTGIPETIGNRSAERVLRAPAAGVFRGLVEIGEHLEAGQIVASVAGQEILAPFSGVLRGILYTGLSVQQGVKIADIDPRDQPGYCWSVSDKSLAIGGGVLEAILVRRDVRSALWGIA